MPEGLLGALQLTAPKAVQSAIAILLEDELKLADHAGGLLRHDIQDAIAILALVEA
jgi:hypothetical protein